MNTAPQELLKEYVQIQHFTSTAEIMRAMKKMFRDVLQTVMEAEMDEELGRERCQRVETSGCPGIGTGASRRRSPENTAGTRTGWRRRLSVSTPAG